MRGERYVRVPERGFRFWWETELDLTRHRSRTSYAWALSDEILLIDGILLDGPRNPSPCVNSNGYLFHKGVCGCAEEQRHGRRSPNIYVLQTGEILNSSTFSKLG
jgi:hypothetical protein